MANCESALDQSVIYVHNNFRALPSPAQHAHFTSRLSSLPGNSAVESWLQTRIAPKLMQPPSVWAWLSAHLLLSDSVDSTLALIRSLCSHTIEDCIEGSKVLECSYLLATLLLAFHRRFKITPRLYYNLYSALYLFENQGGRTYTQVGCSKRRSQGQQNLYRYVRQEEGGKRLTFEQFRIVNYELQTNDCIKIIAFAGTGKTTTLVEYVKMWRNLRFLVLMFNRDVCDDAKKKFSENATCLTTHQLAFRYLVQRGNSREMLGRVLTAGRPMGTKLKVYDVVKAIGHNKGMGNTYVRAKLAIDTVTSFQASDEDEITIDHVPLTEKGDLYHNQTVAIPEHRRQAVLTDARTVWNIMIDPDDRRIVIVHDGYLKRFQLLKPHIVDADGRPYDAILVDEAQDMNPATLSAICLQASPKIFVGDPNQQIYSFRGAVNALDLVDHQTTHTFYLTQSFRFGPEIAFIANCYLNVFKDQKSKVLLGSERQGVLDGTQPVGKSIAVITRTNAVAFDECIKVANLTPARKLHILGGPEKFGLSDILDIYKLMLPPNERAKEGEIKNKFFSGFKNLEDLLGYARKVMDNELEGKIKMVKQHHALIPDYVKRIRGCHTSDQSAADFIVTTAHKAKGLEFDTVRLANDFLTRNDQMDFVHFIPVLHMEVDMQGNVINAANSTMSYAAPVELPSPEQGEDEVNLLYVAMTRAKTSLIMNEALLRFMADRCGDRFESVMPVCRLEKVIQTEQTCLKCKKAVTCDGENLVLFRRQLRRCKSVRRDWDRSCGVFCSSCAKTGLPLNYEWADVPARIPPVAYNDQSCGIDIPERKKHDETRRFWRTFFTDNDD